MPTSIAKSIQRESPVAALARAGQSVWIDFIDRKLIVSGELRSLIEQDGLAGLTSNPAIFEKAIGSSDIYDEQIRNVIQEINPPAGDLAEELEVRDIRAAADQFARVYRESEMEDGYVSYELAPYLALDPDRSITEARRLWEKIDRPNLMIKVPGTEPCVPAIRKLIAEGININITLLFAQKRYEDVAEAYLSGLEEYISKGGDPAHVRSVASFFVSRIDTMVDERLQTIGTSQAKQLLGKVAVANAKLAYQKYVAMIGSARWKKLEDCGARPQRLLWASTSVKNKNYRDTLYVEELVGPDTVNTMPIETLDALMDHGEISGSTLSERIDEAQATLNSLAQVGIDLKEVTDRLTVEGIRKFSEPYDKLITTLEEKRRRLAQPPLNPYQIHLNETHKRAVHDVLDDWKKFSKTRSLWYRDASLWTGRDESQWMGWLEIAREEFSDLEDLNALAQESKEFKTIAVLGMGGSSLCPEVLGRFFAPKLKVLDSTDPLEIKRFEASLDLDSTLFIVSSKSGTTLEPNIFFSYFYELLLERLGEEAKSRFVAITDPDSHLEQVAREKGFRKVFHGVKSIGGRYSALSKFGLVPAAAAQIDFRRMLRHACAMMNACAPEVPVGQNPGTQLGAVMGALAKSGVDKVTLIASPEIESLGAWLEQLIAESTGKKGKGLIPVAGETVTDPQFYQRDRQFFYLRYANTKDTELDGKVAALVEAGFPVVRMELNDLYSVAQEFYRWEFATAVAGSVIGINPFDQPDVEASKIETRRLTEQVEKTGELPAERPFFEADGMEFYADPGSIDLFSSGEKSLAAILRAHLGRLQGQEYFAILAYLDRSKEHEELLQKIRLKVRDRSRVATCVGFGPRFLHSTGQAYKGGPNSGIFLQFTAEMENGPAVPRKKYGFGTVQAAQARGDFAVLVQRERKILRVHFRREVIGRLREIVDLI